ncbi:MAG: HepT-like ribonuclease domain-containing protein [Thermodesulfobacteriota bacterium]
MNRIDSRERDLVKCEDMRIHAERSRQFLGSRSLAEFLSDDLVQAAVIRRVEVIGEAARQVSEETRRRVPDIPWSLIVGMRHVLAHDNGAVDIERVYSAVTENLPELIERLGGLIASLERVVGWPKGDSEE